MAVEPWRALYKAVVRLLEFNKAHVARDSGPGLTHQEGARMMAEVLEEVGRAVLAFAEWRRHFPNEALPMDFSLLEIAERTLVNAKAMQRWIEHKHPEATK